MARHEPYRRFGSFVLWKSSKADVQADSSTTASEKTTEDVEVIQLTLNFC